MKLALPYGTTPYPLELDGRDVTVVEAQRLPPPASVELLIERALDAPIDAPALTAAPGARITVIISDRTRAEPRAAFLEALRRRLPGVRWTLAIATGTHGPCGIARLGIPADLYRDASVVDHDGHDLTNLVELGVTARGTPIRLHRCVVDADLVIATGCIRPHYFAGFGAGVKAIFPGLGHTAAIRENHRLKLDPRSRAGSVVDNPCRADLEDAVARVPTPMFLVNGVCGPDDEIHAVVAGDLVGAFRVGAELARPWFTVRARPAPLVIASDALPITASLYQAAKIAAGAAPWVAPDGTLVIVAECPDGIGPVSVVNDAIFRIGVMPRFGPGVRVVLVSGLAAEAVGATVVEYAPSVSALVQAVRGPILVMPRASHLIHEPSS